MTDDIHNLQDRITEAQKKIGNNLAPPHSQSDDDKNKSLGLRAGSELVINMLAGGLIGYGLDHWLETRPFLFILFLVLGICAGFLNVYKITHNLETTPGFIKRDKPLPKGEKNAK